MNLNRIFSYTPTIQTLLLCTILLMVNTNTSAQDIISDLSNESSTGGVVVVHQSESIKSLLDRTNSINKAKRNKIQGYRIQLFSDYKADARERALKLRADFIGFFPDFDSDRLYTEFEPPFIKVRIGDYRDENSALIDYKKIVGKFPDCYIIKTTINYPPLGQ